MAVQAKQRLYRRKASVKKALAKVQPFPLAAHLAHQAVVAAARRTAGMAEHRALSAPTQKTARAASQPSAALTPLVRCLSALLRSKPPRRPALVTYWCLPAQLSEPMA